MASWTDKKYTTSVNGDGKIVVSWKKEAIPKFEIVGARQKTTAELTRIRKTAPLHPKDIGDLSAIMNVLAGLGLALTLKEVFATSGGRLAVVIGFSCPISFSSQSNRNAAMSLVFDAFKNLNWRSQAGGFVGPTVIRGLAPLVSPSMQFLSIFNIKTSSYTFTATQYLLGLYESNAYGNTLRKVSLGATLPSKSTRVVESLLFKSDPKIVVNLKRPEKEKIKHHFETGLSRLFADANDADDTVAGFGGVAGVQGDIDDLKKLRTKALQEFANELADEVANEKLSLSKAIERAKFVAVRTLGPKGTVIFDAKKHFRSILIGSIPKFEDEMKQAANVLKEELDEFELLPKKPKRQKGKRARAKAWAKAVEENFDRLLKSAAEARTASLDAVTDKLKSFGRTAQGLGRLTTAIQLWDAFSQDEWKEKVEGVLVVAAQAVGAAIVSTIGRYVGGVAGLIIGAAVFGPIGALIVGFGGFLLGGFIGGYYGSVLGEKIILAHPEFVASFAHEAEKLYDAIEDLVEEEIRKILFPDRENPIIETEKMLDALIMGSEGRPNGGFLAGEGQ